MQNGKVFSESKGLKGFPVSKTEKNRAIVSCTSISCSLLSSQHNSQEGFFRKKKYRSTVISWINQGIVRYQEFLCISHVLLFHSQHTFQFIHIIFAKLLVVHHLSRGGAPGRMAGSEIWLLAITWDVKKTLVNNEISDLLTGAGFLNHQQYVAMLKTKLPMSILCQHYVTS